MATVDDLITATASLTSAVTAANTALDGSVASAALSAATAAESAATAALSIPTTQTMGNLIASASTKSAPADANLFGFCDTSAGSVLKKLSWGTIKSLLSDLFSPANAIYAERYATLALADAAAVAQGKQLVISTQWDVVPATLAADIEMKTGGKLNNSGSLSITGSFKGCTGCFLGSGAVTGLRVAEPEWFGAAGNLVANDTVACQRAFNAAEQVNAFGIGYLVDGLTVPRKNFILRGGTSTVFKGSATATRIISVAGAYTTINVTLKDFLIDMSLMADADTTYGLYLTATWGNKISMVHYFSDQTWPALAWPLYYGDSVYTTVVQSCYLPRVASVSQGNGYSSTSNTYICLSTWHVKLRFVNSHTFLQPVIQKEYDKFDIDQCFKIQILGGDIEGPGYYLKGGTNSGITSIGNTFAGFEGAYSTGVFLVSDLHDKHSCYGPRHLTSLVRVGTTVTATAHTQSDPNAHWLQVGQRITISGATSADYNSTTTVLTAPTPTTFTFSIATTPADQTTGTMQVLPDWTENGRYARFLSGKIRVDEIPGGAGISTQDKLTVGNTMYQGLYGMRTDGVTPQSMMFLDESNRINLGDGGATRWFMDGGNFRTTNANKGVILTNGTHTRLCRLNATGDGFVFEAA